jgi:CheY-like chemotaxis protein
MPTVLIVDDSVETLAVHAAYLTRQGYRVMTAVDGDGALACARAHRPDLIVLDHSLPKRTGVEVARELKGDPHTAAIPIVLMTAHSYGAVGRKAAAAGCSSFVAKPCGPGRLHQEVRRYVS